MGSGSAVEALHDDALYKTCILYFYFTFLILSSLEKHYSKILTDEMWLSAGHMLYAIRQCLCAV